MYKQVTLSVICLLAALDLSGSVIFCPFGHLFAPAHDLSRNSFSEIVSTPVNQTNITVSSTGAGSFTSINTAISFIADYCASGLYSGELIRIRVMPGTYEESIDLSPLANYPISSFTLEGIGDITLRDR